MTVFVEPLNLGDLVKYEAPMLYSRDVVSVAAGQVLVLGQVVGRIDASGAITALAPAAADGSQHAVGIVIAPIDASAGARHDGLMLARLATVADHAVVWPAGITPAQRDAAIAQLNVLGVLVRHGV